MAGHRVQSQQANPISANAYHHPALHQLQDQNPHVAGDLAGDYQDGIHQENVPQLVGNVAMQGEMQQPRHIDAPNYHATHYNHPPLPYPQVPQVPYVHVHRFAEPVPAQAHPFAPEVQENYDGYGAHFPAAGPPEVFPGVWPHPAPRADMQPAVDGLRNLAGWLLNNPGTLVNIIQIEPGPGGRFEAWIALELPDIF
jgi:hypothetical protein